MSNMQAFHKRLSSGTEKLNSYQRGLSQLTRISRMQVLSIAGDLTWYFWGADSANQAGQ